jgi:hypothetical protein
VLGPDNTVRMVTCVFSYIRVAIRGHLVLVREPAKVDFRWLGVSLSRCELAESSVRPRCVAGSGLNVQLENVAKVVNVIDVLAAVGLRVTID